MNEFACTFSIQYQGEGRDNNVPFYLLVTKREKNSRANTYTQWVVFISQGRSFTHATETSTVADGTGGTNDDNYTKMGVQTLELISDEAKAKPKVTSDDALQAIFATPVWQNKLELAREEVPLSISLSFLKNQ